MPNYAHVDADCFYVSCERLRSPLLKGKPVAVLGNQGACVIAVSYEMKAAGVHVAMPIWKAKQVCPEGIFIKRDFRWYGVLSRAMQEVLHEFTDHIEYYSVDESFMDLGDLHSDAPALAQHIQVRMKQLTGLPISVGIAGTRLLCKLASKRNKPLGVLVISEENREEILRETPIEKVNGIGRRLIHKVREQGISTALDFAERPRDWVKRTFHKHGETIWYELNGHPVLPINPKRGERKIVSRGGSIWGHYRDPAYIWGFLVRNLERFLRVLWDEELEVRRLTVILRTSQGPSFKSTQALPDYTSREEDLLPALKAGFEDAYQRGPTYCRVHIVGEPVRPRSRKQLNLFDSPGQESPPLRKVRDEINGRYGLFTIRPASSELAAEVFKDKVSDYEIVDIPDKHLF